MSAFTQRICIECTELRIRCILGSGEIVLDEAHQSLLEKHPFSVAERGRQYLIHSIDQMFAYGEIIDRKAFEQYVKIFLTEAGITLFPFGVHTCWIAIPATSNEATKSIWSTVATALGFSEIVFCSSLLAASVGAGFSLPLTRSVCIVHLGHGVSEIGLLNLYGVVYSKRLALTGKFLQSYVHEQVRATQGKIVSSAEVDSLILMTGKTPPRRFGKDAENAWRLQATDVIAEAIDRCILEIALAIEEIGSTQLTAVSEHGVLLTGELSTIVGFAEKLSTQIRIPTFYLPDSELFVCKGLPKLMNGASKKADGELL